MNHLRRELAPIGTRAWQEIDGEARRTLKAHLAARRLVDFEGPLGWQASAVNLGRSEPVKAAPGDGVAARLRQVQPLVELSAEFELSLEELENIERGSKDHDLDPVRQAARAIADAEDHAVFQGYAAGHIAGIAEASSEYALQLSTDYLAYPTVVAEALDRLQRNGIEGPFAIALGPRCWVGLMKTVTPGGYPVIDHVRRLLDGPVVWAPAVDGAIVISLRGGDFELTVGQDLSVGFLSATLTAVRLFIQESLTFRVLSPEAAVPLRYGK
jgi:uncharacterized linocin/CFP29 family protein